MSVTRAQKQAADKSKTGHYPTPLDSEVTKESPYDGRLSKEESTVKERSTTSSRASSQERSRQETNQITQMMAMICTMNKEAEAIRRADREEAQEKQREREEQQRERRRGQAPSGRTKMASHVPSDRGGCHTGNGDRWKTESPGWGETETRDREGWAEKGGNRRTA